VTAQPRMRGDVAVLVPAAGLGTRLGPGAPKALRHLAGVPLLTYVLRRLVKAPSVGHVVVAAPVDGVDAVRAMVIDELPPQLPVDVVAGGPTRQESVAAALAAAPARFGIVLVHDAARAFAPPDLFERVASAVREAHEAVIPVLPVVDTIKRVDDAGHVVSTMRRTQLRVVQTPQGFRRAVLEAAHRCGPAADATDDAALVERLGVTVHCVVGSEAALKITRPVDLLIAEAMGLATDARQP
jgi:2-C-methyl-D-erythritol 4-phosphate cytidylyltransferase